MRKNLWAVAVLAFASLGNVFAADTYPIDPDHSMIIFRIKHMGVGFTYGRFNQPTGTIVLDEADPSKSSVEVEVSLAKVDTNLEARDKHLKSPDFFNAEKFAKATFKSKAVKKAGDNDYEITGDFTLLGATKEVTVKMTKTGQGQNPMSKGTRIGFEGKLEIKRADYGMDKMLEGASNEVQLSLTFEAEKPSAEKPAPK